MNRGQREKISIQRLREACDEEAVSLPLNRILRARDIKRRTKGRKAEK